MGGGQASRSGRLRRRWPVSVNSALATAGAIGGVWIGLEHPHPALRECAVVQAPYRTGSGGLGQVALVGPMRMAYATARAAVQSVATILQQLLG